MNKDTKNYKWLLARIRDDAVKIIIKDILERLEKLERSVKDEE